MAKSIIIGGPSRDMETGMGRWSPLKLLDGVCVYILYTCAVKPDWNSVDGPSVSVGPLLWCGFPPPRLASVRGNVFCRQQYFRYKSTAWFLTAWHPLR